MLTRLVQYSTGAGSAEVAVRALERAEPGDRVILLTADTRAEDADNWRFAVEAARWLLDRVPAGVELTWWIECDGRTPWEVGRDNRVIPNNRMAICSRELKRKLLRRYLDEHHDPGTSVVYLGFDWTEDTRWRDANALLDCAACKGRSVSLDKETNDLYRRRGHCDEHTLADCLICGYTISTAHVHPWWPWAIEAPMMEEPLIEKPAVLDAWRARGIEPPRLYEQGFSHANCGGACVRAGQRDWERLLRWNRERYLENEAAEEAMREMLGADRAVLRHRSGPRKGKALTLREFRERLEREPSLFDPTDVGACGCTTPEPLDDELDEYDAGVPVTIG